MKPTAFFLLLLLFIGSLLPITLLDQEVRCCSKKNKLSEEQVFPLPAPTQSEARLPEHRRGHSRCCFLETQNLRTPAAFGPLNHQRPELFL